MLIFFRRALLVITLFGLALLIKPSFAHSQKLEKEFFQDPVLVGTYIEAPLLSRTGATGYTAKVSGVAQKTYRNYMVRTLLTSSVWSTGRNSVRPEISLTNSRSYSITSSTTINGTSITASGTASISKTEVHL